MSVPDPGPAARMVARLCLQPDALRTLATRTALLAGSLRWHSPAASVFDGRVTRTLTTLRHAADRLDAALAELRRYSSGAGQQ